MLRLKLKKKIKFRVPRFYKPVILIRAKNARKEVMYYTVGNINKPSLLTAEVRAKEKKQFMFNYKGDFRSIKLEYVKLHWTDERYGFQEGSCWVSPHYLLTPYRTDRYFKQWAKNKNRKGN